MSASFASSLVTDAFPPGTELIVDWSSRLSRYETERSVAVVSEHDAVHVNGRNIGLRGEARTHQVDRWLSWLQRGLRTMTAVFAGSSLSRLDPRRAQQQVCGHHVRF